MSEHEILRPRLWRWIAGLFFILCSWLIAGSILTVATAFIFGLDVVALTGTDESSRQTLATYPPWQSGISILISFLPLLLSSVIAYRFFLNRPLLDLFADRRNLKMGRIGRGAAVMSALLLVTSVPDLIFNRADYKFTFDLGAFLPYLLMALIFIPLQTSSEELFFRGYIQRWLDNGRRSIWIVATCNGLLFAAPHLANPEVKGELIAAVISYGSTGFMLSWVTFRDRGMELALGAHAANNLLAGLVVTSSDSALPAASMWTTPEVAWGPASIVSIVMIPLFIWLTRKPADKVAV